MPKKMTRTQTRIANLKKRRDFLVKENAYLREKIAKLYGGTLSEKEKAEVRAEWRAQAAKETEGVQENLIDPIPEPKKGLLERFKNFWRLHGKSL